MTDPGTTADFWSKIDRNRFSGSVYWLGNPLVYRRYQRKAAGGRDCEHWLEHVVDCYLGGRSAPNRVLTVGCGDGALDRKLAAIGGFSRLDGIDLAPGAIEAARDAAHQHGLDHLSYAVLDIEAEDPPGAPYDAIVFSSSLHHVSDLEGVLERCSRSLAEHGVLVVNEYVGPDRFALPDREREVIQAAFRLIPERYRRSLWWENTGELLGSAPLPDPLEVAREDPSESVRSSEIPGQVARVFDVLEDNPIGGTVLQFGLHTIAGHFTDDDPASVEVLEMLFAIEDALIAGGEISSHFRLMVARRR
jgi:SAM-dependent methyltransferase